MKAVVPVCLVAALIALFHAVTNGWSPGVALSSLLTSIILVFALKSLAGLQQLETIALVTWLYWGLSYLSNVIEALYFGVIPLRDAEQSLFGGLLLSSLVACTLNWFRSPNCREGPQQVRVAAGLWWRIPLLAVLFFCTYLSAGVAIHPWIESFYRNRPLPSLWQLASLQFCRGLLDIMCIFPLLRLWIYSRQQAVWFSSFAFAVLCSWSPLLLPNRFLPVPIRLAHGIEMGASGIVFGVSTVLLLLKPVYAKTTQNVLPGRRSAPAPP